MREANQITFFVCLLGGGGFGQVVLSPTFNIFSKHNIMFLKIEQMTKVQ